MSDLVFRDLSNADANKCIHLLKKALASIRWDKVGAFNRLDTDKPTLDTVQRIQARVEGLYSLVVRFPTRTDNFIPATLTEQIHVECVDILENYTKDLSSRSETALLDVVYFTAPQVPLKVKVSYQSAPTPVKLSDAPEFP